MRKCFVQVKQCQAQLTEMEKTYTKLAEELARVQAQSDGKDNQMARLMEDHISLELEMENIKYSIIFKSLDLSGRDEIP